MPECSFVEPPLLHIPFVYEAKSVASDNNILTSMSGLVIAKRLTSLQSSVAD